MTKKTLFDVKHTMENATVTYNSQSNKNQYYQSPVSNINKQHINYNFVFNYKFILKLWQKHLLWFKMLSFRLYT